MKPEQFKELPEFAKVNDALVGANKEAIDIIQDLESGEITYLKQSKERDSMFHKCYFMLLGYIYGLLPGTFKKVIKKKHFYTWLKYLKGEIEIIFEFKDGPAFCEPVSISFSKMDEQKFKEFVRNQLVFIFGDVLPKLLNEKELKFAIDSIEENFERFFDKLNKKEYKTK